MTELEETDRVEYLEFTLAFDHRTVDKISDGLDRASFTEKVFDSYLTEVLPYPFWLIDYPQQVLIMEVTDPLEDHYYFRARVAVLRRPDEDR